MNPADTLYTLVVAALLQSHRGLFRFVQQVLDNPETHSASIGRTGVHRLQERAHEHESDQIWPLLRYDTKAEARTLETLLQVIFRGQLSNERPGGQGSWPHEDSNSGYLYLQRQRRP